jgi:hypothetical protein
MKCGVQEIMIDTTRRRSCRTFKANISGKTQSHAHPKAFCIHQGNLLFYDAPPDF